MKNKIEKFNSPSVFFLFYLILAGLLVFFFRYIFPASPAPLSIFLRQWRILQGLLELFNFFPALVLSALIVPFGLTSFEKDYADFSQLFFKRLFSSLVIAICSAAVYAGVFFFALPMVKKMEGNLRFSGGLYSIAKEQAQERSKAGEWVEASRFLASADQVWAASPETSALRTEIEVNLERLRYAEGDKENQARMALAEDRRSLNRTNLRSADVSALPGEQQPTTASQAISLSETAFNEGRFFDAHWLAVLGGRIASSGSPEEVSAARLASDAWNAISANAPSRAEAKRFSLFELKLSGYRALNSGDWIRAYYIFLELLRLTPDDPDAADFLAKSEQGVLEYAFFIDEMDLTLGRNLTGALFSLPTEKGRAVMRFSNLSTSPDVSYGMGFELMEFDSLSRPLTSMRSAYAKILPVTLNERPQIMIITHAISRHDKNLSWECEWLLGGQDESGLQTSVVVDVSYDDFLLISRVRNGLANLQIDELYLASKRLKDAGFINQIFEAEILNRFGSVGFFLPVAIFVIVLGWRYRARTKPRYLFFVMLPVLPVVFNALVFLYRTMLNTAGVWLVLNLGFSAALVVYIAALVICLFVSMIALAAQHE